jgi:hypothetical protein
MSFFGSYTPAALSTSAGDRDRGVDGVGYHVEDGVRAVFGAVGHEVADDARVDLEKVVAGHAGLAWYARGDDHEVASREGVRELVGAVEPACFWRGS